MAKNLIDLLDEEEYDFEDNIGPKRFRIPREEREDQYRRKKQITQDRKRKRKEKEDTHALSEDIDNF